MKSGDLHACRVWIFMVPGEVAPYLVRVFKTFYVSATMYDENAFAIGDVVQLKSGGQIMTVVEILDDERVGCLYHDREERNFCSNRVPICALRHVSESDINYESV